MGMGDADKKLYARVEEAKTLMLSRGLPMADAIDLG